MMPVVDSVHDMDRPGRNQLAAVFSSLQTHIADPVERLKAIAAASATAKEHNSAMGRPCCKTGLSACHRS